MIVPHTYAGKGVAVLGLGKTGRAALEAFAAAGAAPLVAWDDAADARDKLPTGAAAVAPATIDWSQMDLLVPSPGVPDEHPMTLAARKAGCRITGDVEVLWEAAPEPRYIGVTGTNGKSTTTSLIAHILTQAGRTVAAGSNLGTPALALPKLAADGAYALEMSSYQLALGEHLSFDIAVLLNITPDHLERHGTLEAYVAAKESIFRTGRLSTALIGIDDAECRRIYDRLIAAGSGTIIPLAVGQMLSHGISVVDGVLYDAEREICDLTSAVALPGAHNWQNAGAAYAVARAHNVPEEVIVQALHTYPGLAHRMEHVATIDGIALINDSKATNADAAARALACYDNVYWIAGGKPKSGGLNALRPWLKHVRHACLIGEAMDGFETDLTGDVSISRSGDLATALGDAIAHARAGGLPGAVILFSPACASFDQYPNFEVRGDAFRDLAHALNHRDDTSSGGSSAK